MDTESRLSHRSDRSTASSFSRTLALGLALFLAAAIASCRPNQGPGLAASQSAQDGDAGSAGAPVLLDGLGSLTHPIDTDSPLAQRYFDQGLILTFGFNHEAAIRAFEEAARIDPGCAMCHWGIAIALGPNINAPMGPAAAARAFREVQRAQGLIAAAAPSSIREREKQYIDALATRYAEENPEDRSALDRAFANAMRSVAANAPDDLDAATLFAESLMDLSPWSYWTPDGGVREFTDELIGTLERVLAADPEHVGANHYYIHAVEEFYPKRAEPAADRLGTLAPDAGHLVHMPSHIYWRVGRYDDAASINQRAAAADERYFAWCTPGAFYRAAYYPHNVHFLWAAASAEGRSSLALMTARKLAAATRPSMKEVGLLQEFVAIPMLTLARFARWDALLAEPRPDREDVYLTGVSQYTRGLAHARTNDLDSARRQLSALRDTQARPDAAELMLAGGTANAAALLEIAIAHLSGEIASAEGRDADAIQALTNASTLHDALPYMEPPPWYAPPRQVLGSLLLDAGRARDAEAVYREDLRQYPKNGWSLLGLHQSLQAQGKGAEADWAARGFESAWARADVELSRSRL